ncbi:hypothetical protein LTR17_007174 [Elasticomyces elasticus]|nr:hypothetical protein LTR17_007174 [Elasticomyces elasticus]
MLHVFASYGLHHLIELMLEVGPTNTSTYDLESGIDQELQTLLRERCLQQLEVRGDVGRTPLAVAARSDHVEVAILLLKQGVKPWSLDDRGETCLHTAARGRSVRIVELLLKCKGSDVDVKSKRGLTSLFGAVVGGSVETVELILRNSRLGPHCKGVHVRPGVKFARTPLVQAALSGAVEMCKLFWESDKVDHTLKPDKEVLSRYDALTAGRLWSGETPLILASEEDDLELVELLLEFDRSNICARDQFGRTALIRAVARRHRDVIRLLLDAKAYDIKEDGDNNDLLETAIFGGDYDIVSLMMTLPNIDPIRASPMGMAPLVWALVLYEGWPQLIESEQVQMARPAILKSLCAYCLGCAKIVEQGAVYRATSSAPSHIHRGRNWWYSVVST